MADAQFEFNKGFDGKESSIGSRNAKIQQGAYGSVPLTAVSDNTGATQMFRWIFCLSAVEFSSIVNDDFPAGETTFLQGLAFPISTWIPGKFHSLKLAGGSVIAYKDVPEDV